MAANSWTLLPLKLSTMSLPLESGPVFDCCDQGILQKWHWASFRSTLKRIDTFHLSLWEPWARAVRNLANLRKRMCGEVQRLRWRGRKRGSPRKQKYDWIHVDPPNQSACQLNTPTWPQLLPYAAEKLCGWALPEFPMHKTMRYNEWVVVNHYFLVSFHT